MTGGHSRILVVEDDPETAGQLMEQLTTSGYQVDLASSGNEALSHGAAHDYTVITIDRMLTDIDGIAMMRQLRDGGVAAPFLIITALGEVDDRGLRAGGDDYLVKTFSFLELLARLEADNAKIIEAAKYIYDVKQLDQMLQAVTRCELAERERLYGDVPQ
jgi:two-component system OmpR family response regulator